MGTKLFVRATRRVGIVALAFCVGTLVYVGTALADIGLPPVLTTVEASSTADASSVDATAAGASASGTVSGAATGSDPVDASVAVSAPAAGDVSADASVSPAAPTDASAAASASGPVASVSLDAAAAPDGGVTTAVNATAPVASAHASVGGGLPPVEATVGPTPLDTAPALSPRPAHESVRPVVHAPKASSAAAADATPRHVTGAHATAAWQATTTGLAVASLRTPAPADRGFVSSGPGGSSIPPSTPGNPFEPLGFAGGISPGGGLGQLLFAAFTLFFLLAAPLLGRRLRLTVGMFWSPVFLALHERPG